MSLRTSGAVNCKKLGLMARETVPSHQQSHGNIVSDTISLKESVAITTISDSEALIHLAYVQHMWQSKFVVVLEDLTRWRIETC